MPSPHAESALRESISAHFELNGLSIEELHSEPSPLEFMRYVSRNTPFVVRGGASTWKATQRWNEAYLRSALKGQTVNVAVTPHGNADAPSFLAEHGVAVLAKPHQEDQMFDDFLTYIIQQEQGALSSQQSEVRYAQTQNDNMRGEYDCLLPDAQNDIPFARIALQKHADAVNLWIGNSKSVTATHKDNFENIFVQIIGRKHFVLLPPVCQPCVNESHLMPATYEREGHGLSLRLDDNATSVPFATWDPDHPEANSTALSRYAHPIRVSLNPGDMLYLPAMWYHKVSQSAIVGTDNFVVAINYWYDMDFCGPLYAFASLVRATAEGDV
ncbi:Transcription factor jumonji/aspartyl beta-hydroxylase [Moelleriella libera RCEF 2490]|uniref:Transcription factor jumonji/aspartyl beta-hydroxylase n=1 Tax=Moelleriella libera RCEF 2490 TaxID=1081109 RepID=A0A166NGT3_9HYPO|nr:Transcription factor jumonji/aspartyl beta-hydroxylase [Moelleriella libera RCEF 2490]